MAIGVKVDKHKNAVVSADREASEEAVVEFDRLNARDVG